jgi:plasmid stabilization system protein ParE
MLKLRLSTAAEQHLEDIWLYTISEWGEDQAEESVALIEKALSLLPDNPYRRHSDGPSSRPNRGPDHDRIAIKRHARLRSPGGRLPPETKCRILLQPLFHRIEQRSWLLSVRSFPNSAIAPDGTVLWGPWR